MSSIITRRSLILTAPAVVAVSSLMPISARHLDSWEYFIHMVGTNEFQPVSHALFLYFKNNIFKNNTHNPAWNMIKGIKAYNKKAQTMELISLVRN